MTLKDFKKDQIVFYRTIPGSNSSRSRFDKTKEIYQTVITSIGSKYLKIKPVHGAAWDDIKFEYRPNETRLSRRFFNSEVQLFLSEDDAINNSKAIDMMKDNIEKINSLWSYKTTDVSYDDAKAINEILSRYFPAK